MKFDWKTKEGLQNILNSFCAVVMLLAATYFGWDNTPIPGPPPLPDVTIIAEEVTMADRDYEPTYSITGFSSREQADRAADLITAEDEEAGPGPVTGFSVGFLLALFNLLSQYFGRRRS